MIGMSLNRRALDVLCLGAHPDDIEIGCGGALLRLARRDGLTLSGVVLTGDEDRSDEARVALDRFVPGSKVETVRAAGRPSPVPLGADQAGAGGRRHAETSRPGVRAAGRRRPPGPPAGRLARDDGVARRPGAALRDPEVGRRHGLTDALRRPDARGGAPQGRAAQRELPEPDRPRLVGRRDVPGPPAYQGHGVAAPVCGGVLRVEGAPGPGRSARRCHEDGRVARTGAGGRQPVRPVRRGPGPPARPGARGCAHLRPRSGPVPRGHGTGHRPRPRRPGGGPRRQHLRRVRHGAAGGHARATATNPSPRP